MTSTSKNLCSSIKPQHPWQGERCNVSFFFFSSSECREKAGSTMMDRCNSQSVIRKTGLLVPDWLLGDSGLSVRAWSCDRELFHICIAVLWGYCKRPNLRSCAHRPIAFTKWLWTVLQTFESINICPNTFNYFIKLTVTHTAGIVCCWQSLELKKLLG